VPFSLIHLSVLSAFWLEVTWVHAAVCAGTVFMMVFGITAGYHRYFSHRSFKTSRWMQFALAFLAQTSAQKGVLWWAAHHRDHHKHSDTVRDIHSPVQWGFWYSHMGWLFAKSSETKVSKVRDLAKYPELRWLNRNCLVPPTLIGILYFVIGGAPLLVVGFLLALVITWHNTFLINSLAHVFGKRVYDTPDDSRNNWLLALMTLGEGWHNNHHHYMLSARQGFRWWEIDITYYILKIMSWVGLVWEMREPPPHVVAGTIKAQQQAAAQVSATASTLTSAGALKKA